MPDPQKTELSKLAKGTPGPEDLIVYVDVSETSSMPTGNTGPGGTTKVFEFGDIEVDDSSFVHKTGNETISGTKTFSGDVNFAGDMGDTPSVPGVHVGIKNSPRVVMANGTTGQNCIIDNNSGEIRLIVGGSVAATVGVNTAYVNRLDVCGKDVSSYSRLYVDTVLPNLPGIVVRGATSQSANLFEAQDSNGVSVASISLSGQTIQPTTNGLAFIVKQSGGSVIASIDTSSNVLYGHELQCGTNITLPLSGGNIRGNSWGDFTITNAIHTGSSPSSIPFRVRGATSQSANLFEAQDSNSATMTEITSIGGLLWRDIHNNQVAYIGRNPGNASQFTVDLPIETIRGAGNGSKASVAGGWFSVGSYDANITSDWQTVFLANGVSGRVGIGGVNPSSGRLVVYSKAADDPVLIVRGATSQSANLFEAQDSNGVAKAWIMPNGGIAQSDNRVLIGPGAALGPEGGIAIGVASYAEHGSFALGGNAYAVGYYRSCALGESAKATASGQLAWCGREMVNQGWPIRFTLQGMESTYTYVRDMADIGVVWVDATDASRTTRLTFSSIDHAGAREGLRIESDGTQAKLGFYGFPAVIRPQITGSRTDGTALASLLASLDSLGLIDDATTA